MFDLGGGKNIRRVWKSYLAEVHAVVFVVDAADFARFAESRTVFHETLQDPHLADKPILVFANKQDLEGAASAAALAEQLGLADLRSNPYNIKACTARTPAGEAPDPRLRDGLTWVMGAVAERYDTLQPRVEADTRAMREEEARKKAEREARVRQMKEERARKAAEEAAAAAACTATPSATPEAWPSKPSNQQHNALGDAQPDGSPRIGTTPVGKVKGDATSGVTPESPHGTDFHSLADAQASPQAAQPIATDTSMGRSAAGTGRPPVPPGAGSFHITGSASGRLSTQHSSGATGQHRVSSNSGQSHTDMPLVGRTSSNKVVPVP